MTPFSQTVRFRRSPLQTSAVNLDLDILTRRATHPAMNLTESWMAGGYTGPFSYYPIEAGGPRFAPALQWGMGAWLNTSRWRFIMDMSALGRGTNFDVEIPLGGSYNAASGTNRYGTGPFPESFDEPAEPCSRMDLIRRYANFGGSFSETSLASANYTELEWEESPNDIRTLAASIQIFTGQANGAGKWSQWLTFSAFATKYIDTSGTGMFNPSDTETTHESLTSDPDGEETGCWFWSEAHPVKLLRTGDPLGLTFSGSVSRAAAFTEWN